MGGHDFIAAAGHVEKARGGQLRLGAFGRDRNALGGSRLFQRRTDAARGLVGAFTRGLHQILDHLAGDAISEVRQGLTRIRPGKQADQLRLEIGGDRQSRREHFIILRPAGERDENLTDGHISLHLPCLTARRPARVPNPE